MYYTNCRKTFIIFGINLFFGKIYKINGKM